MNKRRVTFGEAEKRHAKHYLSLAWDALVSGDTLPEIEKPNFTKAIKVAKAFSLGLRSFIKAHIIARHFKL